MVTIRNNGYIFILLIFVLVGCGKEEMSNDQIQFNGISPRDENGQQLGALDLSDWNLTDKWENNVYALFDNQKGDLCSNSEDYIAYNAAPNPIPQRGNEFLLGYRLQDSVRVEIRIVDRNYELLQSIDIDNVFGPGYNVAAIRINEFSKKTDTIRVYYKLIQKDKCELRGHGDVAILR